MKACNSYAVSNYSNLVTSAWKDRWLLGEPDGVSGTSGVEVEDVSPLEGPVTGRG